MVSQCMRCSVGHMAVTLYFRTWNTLCVISGTLGVKCCILVVHVVYLLVCHLFMTCVCVNVCISRKIAHVNFDTNIVYE